MTVNAYLLIKVPVVTCLYMCTVIYEGYWMACVIYEGFWVACVIYSVFGQLCIMSESKNRSA